MVVRRGDQYLNVSRGRILWVEDADEADTLTPEQASELAQITHGEVQYAS